MHACCVCVSAVYHAEALICHPNILAAFFLCRIYFLRPPQHARLAARCFISCICLFSPSLRIMTYHLGFLCTNQASFYFTTSASYFPFGVLLRPSSLATLIMFNTAAGSARLTAHSNTGGFFLSLTAEFSKQIDI